MKPVGEMADTVTDSTKVVNRPPIEDTGSLYRTPQGFREADSEPAGRDSSHTEPISISALMDSVALNLPDTAEFSDQKYKVKFQPDYVARPTIGYTRDNFGRGFYGGSAIQLSDMLGNHNLLFSLFINGRITEAQVGASYFNLTNRLNWGVGLSQEPYYFIEPSFVVPANDGSGDNVLVTNIQRIVYRSAQFGSYYPIDRFRRLEGNMAVVNVDEHIQRVFEQFDPVTGILTQDPVTREAERRQLHLPGAVGGIRIRQLAAGLRSSLLRQAVAAERRSGGRRLAVHLAAGGLSPLRSPAGSVHFGHPAAGLWPVRPG